MVGEQSNVGVVDSPPARGRWNQQLSESDGVKCVEQKAGAFGRCREPTEGGMSMTNMERFLKATTPSVPAQFTSKMTMRDLKTCNVEYQPHFVLADLWDSFREWSAYGAGVPLLLNARDFAVQYYVPFLSAIQIYVHPSKSPAIASSTKMALKEGFSAGNDAGPVNPHGRLLFQYLEQDNPFTRPPLFRKISDLALHFPELKNLKSCDMLSSSWVSVAWYPIYRIPTGPSMRDLEACFLTYHSLHTPPLGDVSGGVQAPVVTYPNGIDGVPKISLPSFGLSSYKYRGSMWVSDSSSGQKMVKSLSEAASNWLRMLQIHHPDYAFFFSRR